MRNEHSLCDCYLIFTKQRNGGTKYSKSHSHSQDHISNKWQVQDLHPGSLALEYKLCPPCYTNDYDPNLEAVRVVAQLSSCFLGNVNIGGL